MNFYPRFPGDYAKKTARLSLAEHGAYTLLLDEVYSTEEPLPADADELCRICRALTKDERAAVIKVADKFFPVGSDGVRHNERADQEIALARPKIDAAKANGKKGGRPKKETQKKPSGFSMGSPEGSPDGNPEETQSQSSPHPHPDVSSLRSETLIQHTPSASTVAACVSSTQAGLICKAMREQGVSDTNPGHLDLLRLIEAGATLDEFVGAAADAVRKSKGFAYAVGIVRRRREEAAQAPAMHQGALPQRQPTQAELNTLAAGAAMGLYKPSDFGQPAPEVIDVDAKRISA